MAGFDGESPSHRAGMAGFDGESPSIPGVGMAGFDGESPSIPGSEWLVLTDTVEAWRSG